MEKPSKNQQYYLRGYAQALQDVLKFFTGDNGIAKHYDPIDFDDTYIHSYAFNLRDGGRHHPLTDYEDIYDLTSVMLNEVCEDIKFYLNESSE